MDDSRVILLLVVILILVRVYNSEENIYERLLCENSSVKLQCPMEKLVDDINITASSDVDEESCYSSLPTDTADDTKSWNQEPISSCIGRKSCELTGKMINMSYYTGLGRTRKFHVKFNCVLGTSVNISRPDKTVCPLDISSVVCNQPNRRLLVLAVNLTQETFVCSTPDLNNTCRKRIEEDVKSSCNTKRRCDLVSISTLDECIKIPKRAKITFTCKESRNENSIENKYNIAGVSVGVTAGVVLILGALFVKFWFAKRKDRDTVQSRSHYTDADTTHTNTSYEKLNCKTVTNKTYENPDAVIPCLSHRQHIPTQEHKGYTAGDSVIGTADVHEELSPDPYSYVSNCNTSSASIEYDTPNMNVNHYELSKPIEDSDASTHFTDDDKYSYDISRHADFPDQHKGLYNRSDDSMYNITSNIRPEDIVNQTYDHCRSETNT
ncbi:uncharacterized protein LOC127710066 [Mytilus californianus]|uniref:uncharacterized protein LOC127710066 n=1 Tax=Mytilus californianus TaxID=6549 RepID=UPI0022477436|nr:uncharacterized protein LOC127710066 [Mytilus californianus]